jgi:hypothetical protein
MHTRDLHVIQASGLHAFRDEHLSPVALRALIEQHVQVLLRIPVGVGKTHAAIELLCDPLTYARFDLVIYAAPAWDILDEVMRKCTKRGAPASRALEARPAERCGELNDEWTQLEKQKCGVYARNTICAARCPRRDGCDWVDQLKGLSGVKLVFVTEQRLVTARTLVLKLLHLTKAKSVLIVLDEAQTIDGNFEVVLTHEALNQYAAVLASVSGNPTWVAARDQALESIALVLQGRIDRASIGRDALPMSLTDAAFNVQAKGVQMFGKKFSYLGFDLAHLPYAREHERFALEDRVRFIARPYLDRHMVLLAANLDPLYVAHRLRSTPIASPFENVRFEHPGTRIINVTDLVGAGTHFSRSKRRVLDPFAVLIARNLLEGRTTVLVARKDSKAAVAKYLRARLAKWGHQPEFVTDDYTAALAEPKPDRVPILHYGVLGVNLFEEYECLYCVNSYYISDDVLTKAVTQFERTALASGIRVLVDQSGHRSAVVDAPSLDLPGQVWIANLYLRLFEIGPVLQAAGRVRPLTKRREVVFFQAADLRSEFTQVETVRTLSDLVETLKIPTSGDVDRAIEACALDMLVAQGLTRGAAGERLGLSRSTAFRRQATQRLGPESELLAALARHGAAARLALESEESA